MKLRKKTLFIIGSAFLLMIIISYLSSRIIILRSFNQLENDNVVENLKRVQGVLSDSLLNMKSVNYDYASWDSTYEFMQDRNSEFIKREFPDDTFSKLRINVLMLIDSRGDIVYKRGFDYVNQSELPVSQSLLQEIEHRTLIVQSTLRDGNMSGIMLLPEGPILISSYSILTSEDEGPPRGVLLMGRYLNSYEIEHLGKVANLPFSLIINNEKNLIKEKIDRNKLTDSEPYVVKPVSKADVSGYALLNDIHGKASLTMKIELPRDIYNYGRNSVNYFMLSTVIIAILIVILIMHIIQMLFLRRVQTLDNYVSNIGTSIDHIEYINMTEKDEISNLANAVNEMLKKLKHYIDEQKITENKLLESNEKLKELDKLKTDFLSTVSHELRTPLTSILGFTKIIRKKLAGTIIPNINSEEEKVKKTVSQVLDNTDIIISEGERLTSLINEVLDIAKIEEGKVEWKREKVSLRDIIDKAFEATYSLYSHKNLKVVFDIGDGLQEITGDRDRLIQVLINIISNAVKFTEKGSITCRVRKDLCDLVVSIEDTGIGIEEKDREKVFEKFKQSGDTLTNKPKGTGLGLAICKEIIEHHGGRIWVESKLNEGSKFMFTLPVSQE